MKKTHYILTLLIAFTASYIHAQESDDYIEFDDRKNVVHGVYLGLNFNYGELDGQSTYFAGAKIAYVANQKFEVGFAGVGFYSDQNTNGPLEDNDIVGGYGGLHFEPIFFGDSQFSISLPMLIGAGAAAHYFDEFEHVHYEELDPFFVFEPGVSILYNISSYLQFEMGVKYRLTSDFDGLFPGSLENLNGFSGGIGLKIGVFNLGKKK